MAGEFDVQGRLKEIHARLQGIRPGIIPQTGPVRNALGIGGNGPGIRSLFGRTSGAAGPGIPSSLFGRTSGAAGPPGFNSNGPVGQLRRYGGDTFEVPGSGVVVTREGYRLGVSPRPTIVKGGYRLTT